MKSASDLLKIFSCRYYTELASKRIDGPLTLREKCSFRFHNFICTFCRRSRRQIEVIQQVLKRREKEKQQVPLSDNAKERIQFKINQNL